jgi:hypothetical protein
VPEKLVADRDMLDTIVGATDGNHLWLWISPPSPHPPLLRSEDEA